MEQLKQNVTFKFKSLGTESVNLAGTFNGWSPQPMNKHLGGIFKLSLSLPSGHYLFKFVLPGDRWLCDDSLPTATDNQGNVNNVKIVSADSDCIFCKIVSGIVPSCKIAETDSAVVFLDVCPVSQGHCLIVPKYHCKTLDKLPPGEMEDIGPLLVRLAQALKVENYNLLQNNGEEANQGVLHVHFHMIPKPDKATGLGILWPSVDEDSNALNEKAKEIKQAFDSLSY